ncbi:MAG: GGDEF domain-containing protein [Halanaerobiales bacterium]
MQKFMNKLKDIAEAYPDRRKKVSFMLIYFLVFAVYFLLPFMPAFIPVLYLPLIYFTVLSNLRSSILVNTLYLVLVAFYLMVKNSILPGDVLPLFLSAGIYTYSSVLIIEHFTRSYREKQKELSSSMEDLAASYRNLESTQTKLMALTWITKELLKYEDIDKLLDRIIVLLNDYLLYENIVYFSWSEDAFNSERKLGFEDKNEYEALQYINDINADLEPEAQLTSGNLYGQDCRIMYIPFLKGGELKGVLLVVDETDWSSEEDKYVLDILSDHINLILDKIKLIEDTQELAVTDQGTNLYNQRFFYRKLDDIYNLSRENGYSFSVVIFDVDNFKDINDKYGHLTGDMVLEELGEIMLDNVRSRDIVARYGGDEFALILPMTGRENACGISQRILQETESHVFSGKEGYEKIRTSLSGGVASFPEIEVEEAEELVQKADEALYESKARGKNRVIFAGM